MSVWEKFAAFNFIKEMSGDGGVSVMAIKLNK
jgi:hypothetical protein